jgi:hypothetical protein
MFALSGPYVGHLLCVSSRGRRRKDHFRLACFGPDLPDDALEVELGLDPVQLLIPAVQPPELLGDSRHQAVRQIEFTLLVLDRADDEFHAGAPC